MLKIFKWIIKAASAGIISITFLSAVTIVYSHSGVHITNRSGATDYKWESNQFKSTMAEGFSWFRMNGEGFNNSFDIEETGGVDALLIGSSHMEGVNVSKDKNAGYILNSSLADFTTYNIGTSGHTIYHCVNNLQGAVSYYNPEKYIIIETDRIDLDEDQMRQVLDGEFSHIPSYDSGLKYKIQKYIPCFLPLYRELKNWMSASTVAYKDQIGDVTEVEGKHSDAYVMTLNKFVNKIASDTEGRSVIIVYHPNMLFNGEGELLGEDSQYLNDFEKACVENEIIFVDMYDDFKEMYEKEHKLAHGFFNTAVGCGHLNNDGHKLIANRLLEIIRGKQSGIK